MTAADLVQRLRADFENDPNSNAGEAAARIEALEAENARLRALLAPPDESRSASSYTMPGPYKTAPAPAGSPRHPEGAQ